MTRFEDAIVWVMNGGRARRACWAKVPTFTQTTPPLFTERTWRIWMADSTGSIVQGWGGQVGMELSPNDPIRDGTYYEASDEDRLAADWVLFETTWVVQVK